MRKRIIKEKEKDYIVQIREKYFLKYPFDSENLEVISDITSEVRKPFGDAFGPKVPTDFSKLVSNLQKLRQIEKKL